MKEEIEYVNGRLQFREEWSDEKTLPINLLQDSLERDLCKLNDDIDELKKKKKPLQILLNKIKPYIKQNKLRGSELLKAKGIEK